MKYLKYIPIILLIYLVIDYFNLLMFLGIRINNINVDILNILITTLTAIILYIISYHYIEKRQVDKDANAKDVVKTLLEKAYKHCLSNIDLLNDEKHLRKYIVPKVDFDEIASESKIVQNLQNNPFSSFDTIMSFSQAGYVSTSELDAFLDIRSAYQMYVNLKITFYDLADSNDPAHKIMQHEIEGIYKNLVGKINAVIDQE